MSAYFDYTQALLTFQGKRKHVFRDQKYHISIFKERIIIGKTIDDQEPKYVLSINLKEKIHWVVSDKNQVFNIVAFGFSYGTKLKNIHAGHDSLQKMRQIIACTVNFSQVGDFYSPEFNIGEGSSAKVFQCKSIQCNGLYAIKAINKQILQSQNYGIRSFEIEVSIRRELTQQKAINSQYFINLHEVFEGHQTFYLVTDLMEGWTLFEEINIHREKQVLISNESVKIIMRRLLEGVKVIHESNIIHRDLKPQNIMFQKIGQYDSLKIVDFGLATKKNVDQYLFPKCGTPGYVAPEILNSNDKSYLYSEVCDIFSCGVIFYQLITGKKLFRAVNIQEILNMNKQCQIDFHGENLLQIDKFQLQLLKAMLIQDPSWRITASEALDFQYFTGLNAQPQNSQQQQQTIQTSIMNLQPQNQFTESQEEQKDQSPFGKFCKTKKENQKFRFNPKLIQKVHHEEEDKQQKQSFPENSEKTNLMNEGQGDSNMEIHSLPTRKQLSYRSKSIDLGGNPQADFKLQKERSLNNQQISNSQKSTSKKIQFSQKCDASKLKQPMMDSFYMKEPLSVVVRYQQIQPSLQLISLDNNEVIPEQQEQIQPQSFIQEEDDAQINEKFI